MMFHVGIKHIVLGFLVLMFHASVSQEFPPKNNPPTLVTDHAQMLQPDEERRLEQKLVQFDDTSSTQIAIVTVPTIGSYDISDYSFQLAEDWGIGQEGFDNGILIVVALDDRKMFIATGYGVEEFVPDAIAKRIVEGTLKPNFRQQQYYQGLDEATNILIGLTNGQFSPEQLESDLPSVWSLLLLFLLILFFFIFISVIVAKGIRRGGNGRKIDSRTIMGPYRGGGGWTDFSGGSGTFGGGSGGGFGGFGGGSFGGGGAGGSW